MKILSIFRIALFTSLLIIIFLTTSCHVAKERKGEKQQDGQYEYENSDKIWTSIDYKIEEKTIDSCKYIIIFGSEGRSIIHKENCDNPFHISNKRKQ